MLRKGLTSDSLGVCCNDYSSDAGVPRCPRLRRLRQTAGLEQEQEQKNPRLLTFENSEYCICRLSLTLSIWALTQ